MNYKQVDSVAAIVSAIIAKENIQVSFAKSFEEIGLKDIKSGAYMTLFEVIDNVTKYIEMDEE